MRPLVALIGLVSALASCAQSEPAREAESEQLSSEGCASHAEARRLSAVDPAAARATLDAALAAEPAGSACRARLAALSKAIGSRDAAPPERVASGREAPSGRARLEKDRGQSHAPKGASVVVLDPGHGGNEYGATSEGVRESRLTLDIAKRAAEVIRSRQPEIEVKLTRDGDRRVSLEQRAAMANAVGAAAFVSIHLNDAVGEVRRGGVTTFVLDTTDDEQAIRLAARENGTSMEEVSALSVLLASLERKTQLEASRRLAARVHAETLRGARRHLPKIADRGIRPALFQVLVGARMPAILVEASFMNIPGEREALRTVRYRQLLAEGIAQGILSFFFEEA